MGDTTITPDLSTYAPFSPAQPDPASTLRSSISYGATQNPDAYAKLRVLHQQTGVPPQVAQGQESDVQHAADVNSLDYTQMAVDHPRTTAWATNPDNAAVAGVDEVKRLAGIEKHATSIRAMSPWENAYFKYLYPAQKALTEYPLTRFAIGTVGGASGLVGDVGSFVGLHGDGPTQQNLLQRVETHLDPEQVGVPSSGFDWAAKNVGPMIPAFLASGGTSLLARTLGISTKAAKVLTGLSIGGMFTASQGGKTYSQMIESGASEDQARLAANRVALINAPANALFGATDFIPFLKDNPVLSSLVLGGATGASGQVSQNVVTGKPWSEGISSAAVQGAAVQGGMHLGTEMFFDRIGQMVTDTEQSKLKQRSPEAFHDAMQSIFEGDPSLRIPAEKFTEYFHSKGLSAQRVAEELGSPNYAEALLSGGEVEVPTAEFLSKLDTEHQKGLLTDIVDPNSGLTMRQHEEARTELDKWVTEGGPQKLQQEAAKADAETAATPEYSAVKEQLRQRYTDAGETPQVADDLATKDANVYANLAKQVGMKADELLKLYNPQVKAAEAPGVEGQLNQDGPLSTVEGKASTLKGRGEWNFKSIAGPDVDADNPWVVRVTTYTSADGTQVIVRQGGPRFQISSPLGNIDFRRGTAMQIGSAVNNYLKENFGFRHSYRPQHPFQQNRAADKDVLYQDTTPHISYDESGNITDADGRHRVIAALERGDKSIAIQTTMRDGGVQTLHVDPQLVAQRLGVTPESLRATDAQQAQYFKTLYQDAVEGGKGRGKTQKENQDAVVAAYPDAALKRTPQGNAYHVLAEDWPIGPVGYGSTPAKAWADAADSVAKFKTSAEPSSAAPAQPRGWFRVMPDGSFEIGKTSIGDLSTFVHEPAHGYLQLISDLAKREGASDTLKGDYAKILDFIGAKDGEALTTEQQETWARANEQYLREGKAPSEGLKGVFQRFAIWLSSVYKKASDLGVTLTDDIRGVFDRLYAAEEGVNRAESEVGPRLFQSAEEAGWTDEQFQKYAADNNLSVDQAKAEIVSKLNEAAVREKTESWIREENNVRQAMTEEVNRKPEYIAMRALRKGKMEDGTELSLNRDELVKQFGEERVKELQKKHPGMYRNEGGMDVDTVAEMLGYDSGDRMLKALEASPRRSAAITEATKAYMTSKHGDIRYDGTLDDQARLAVANEKRSANLYGELKALRKKVAELKTKSADEKAAARGIEIAPLDAYRTAAQQMVESKAIADLQPNRYLDASRKYSREAFDALRGGDVEKAADAKHKELMNHFLFREATKARDVADKIETYAKKMSQVKELRKLGLAGQPYLEQIQSLLGRYGFDRGRSLLDPGKPRSETLDQFVTRLKNDEGLDLPIDPAILDESGPNRNYRSLPFSELKSVYEAMRMIDHAAKVVNSVRGEQQRLAIAHAAVSLNQRLEESVGKPDVRKASDRARSFMERVKDVNLDIAVQLPEFMFERFDGLSKQGPWHDYFWNRYNDAADHLNRLREMVFPKIMEYRGTKVDRSKKFYIESIDRTLTKDDIISIALNSGNESNLEKQMRGGIQFEKDEGPTQLSQAALHEILSHLTPEEIKMVNGIWQTISLLKPEAAALERKRTGVEPTWIEPKSLDIANGTLEGGYYPLKYDPRFSSAGEKQADASTVQQMFAKFASATTRQGYLKGRTQFFAPLTLDWQATVSRHLDEAAIDISHWEFASDSQRLLKNAEVKASIVRNMGDAYYKNLLSWVRYTVNQDSMGREASDNIDRFRRTMRNNVATAVLGFRVGNAVAEAAITPLLAVQHVSPESAFKGMMTFMRNPVEAMKFASEASDYMKRIDKEVDRDITVAINDLAGKTSLLDDVRRWAISSRMWFWKMGAAMSWHAGYADAMKRGIEGDEAVRIADSIYRMTQESGRPGDLSAVQRNPYMKELTQFIGPSLIQYNNYRRTVSAFKDQGFTSKTAAIGMSTLFAAFANNVVFNLMRGKGPKDGEWPAWLLARMTFGMVDGLPILRDASGYAEGKLLGEHGKDFRLSPALQVGKDTVDAALATAHAVEGKTSTVKAVKQSARAVGGLTGLPATQGAITGQYVYDVLTGQYKPQNPWSPVTDALYSRPAQR